MAVTEVILSSQGSSGEASGTDSGTVKASYQSTYRVKCSSAADTIDEVLHHFRVTSSLPWMGRRFKFGNGFNASVLCKKVRVDQVENGDGRFLVSCAFESIDSSQDDNGGQQSNGQQTNNPLLFHDEISVGYQNISIPVEEAILYAFHPRPINNPRLKKGYKGPIVNSLAKPYDTPLEKESRIKVVRITKHFQSYDDSLYDDYLEAINDDAFTIDKPQYNFRMTIPPFRARFGDVQSEFAITNGIKHYRTTIELLIIKRQYGWMRLVPDMGRDRGQFPEVDKDDFGNTITNNDTSVTRKQLSTPIKDKDGNPVQDPVLLDGNGQPLTKLPTVYMVWRVDDLKSFAGLGL